MNSIELIDIANPKYIENLINLMNANNQIQCLPKAILNVIDFNHPIIEFRSSFDLFWCFVAKKNKTKQISFKNR